MPPECEDINDRGVPEKISCIDGKIKDHLRFAAPAKLCGRRAMVNKIWCQEVVRKWFYKKDEPPHPRCFTEPRCQKHVADWYLLYRWLILGAWASILVCSIFEFGSYKPMGSYEKWPIYLTNWDLAMGLGQALFGVLLVSRRWKLQRVTDFDPSTQTIGTMERIYWFLYVVTTNVAVCVTITYWCSVYDPKVHDVDPLNIMLHICNSILMIIDFCITNIPFRLRNFWWCLTIVASYVLFSLVYYLAGGLDKNGYHYIYKILDWKKPIRASLVCMGQAVLITVLYSLVCLLERLKNWVYSKITGKSDIQIPIAEKHVDIV